MPSCPKCGNEVRDDMTFCPKCGAPLKAEAKPPVSSEPRVRVTHEKEEKGEKHEKNEKREKGEQREKYEKGEFGFVGLLIGGLILVFVGFTAYLQMIDPTRKDLMWAVFFVIVGILVIFGAAYGAMATRRRHPQT